MKDLVHILQRDHDGAKVIIPNFPGWVGVGSSKDSDFVTKNFNVPNHFRVSMRKNDLEGVVCCVKNYHPIFINGKRDESKTTYLNDGDRITLKECPSVLYTYKVYGALKI